MFKSVYGEAKVLKQRNYKAGYVVQDELVSHGGSKDLPMKVAYNTNGDYIGNPRDAYRLCKKRGIAPELRTKDSKTCSIGFNEKEQKWYGWSHRAIFGFGIGSKVKKGDCTNSSGYTDEYLEEHPEASKALPVGFGAKTLEDAKKMAMAFSESVS